MADVPAKRDEPEPPAEGRAVMPRAEPWQTAPPGPPGAAIEPPPCSPSGAPFQAMAAPVSPRYDMPPAPHEGYPPPLPVGAFVFGTVPPRQVWEGPYRAPLYRTDPNAVIGRPTPPDQLKRMEDAAGFTSPAARGWKEPLPYDRPPDAPRR